MSTSSHTTTSSLRRRLESTHLSTIEHIHEHVTKLWVKGELYHPFFTLHGPDHLRSVEAILGDLLAADHDNQNTSPVRKSLSEYERFLLIASAWLHDIGMITPMTEAERLDANRQGLKEADYIRAYHHRRARPYIMGHAADLHLDAASTAAISQICEAHRKIKLSDLSDNQPNIRFLGALLRTADELDVSNTRAPIEWLRLNWNLMDGESRWHWVKHCVLTKSTHEHHIATDAKPPLWELSYHYIFTLPEPALLTQLFAEVLRPITRVLHEEDAQLILARHGISVKLDRFKADPVPCSDSEFEIPVSETLKSIYREQDLLPPSIGEGFRRVYSGQNELQLLVRRQADRVFRITGGSQNLISFITAQVGTFLDGLAVTPDQAHVEILMEQVKTGISQGWPERSSPFTNYEPLKADLNVLIGLMWRAYLFIHGNAEVQRSQLSYLVISLGPAATNLCADLVAHSRHNLVRTEAIKCLQSVGDSSCSPILMEASKSEAPELRRAAVTALVRLRPPGLFTRLGEILDGDVDTELRKIVQTAFTTTMFGATENDPQVAGRVILIIDHDQTCVVPLARTFHRPS